MISELLDRFNLRWSRKTADAAARVDNAFAEVTKSNGELRRAALDNVDSESHVSTTIEALMNKIDRRELGTHGKTANK